MTAITPIAAMPSALQSATGAIRKAVQAVDQDAHVVANSQTVMSRDTIEALIDARQQVLYTRAAARIVSASDEMVKSLLDTRA